MSAISPFMFKSFISFQQQELMSHTFHGVLLANILSLIISNEMANKLHSRKKISAEILKLH